MEQRRILWTTYKNLKLWFDNWKQFLEELGFAHRNDDCDLVVPPDQLARILNFDETCLSLDGSKGNRGGRPEVIFFNPNFPQLGRGTSKTSLTTTYITASSCSLPRRPTDRSLLQREAATSHLTTSSRQWRFPRGSVRSRASTTRRRND